MQIRFYKLFLVNFKKIKILRKIIIIHKKMKKRLTDITIKFFIALSIILALIALFKPDLIKQVIEWLKQAIN